MANNRCRFSLGNDRYVEVHEWQGELRVDIREWKDDKPTKKGISLNLMRWKNWVNQLEYVDKALENKQSLTYHLAGNVFCKIGENSVCVDIRKILETTGRGRANLKRNVFETVGILQFETTLTRNRKRIARTKRRGTLFSTKRSYESVGRFTVLRV